jgi:hypothetical protein
MMNLLALLQSDNSKLQNTFTRGGSWGILVKLNPADFSEKSTGGEFTGDVITSTGFRHHLKEFTNIYSSASVMCVLGFKLDSSLAS